MSNLLKERARWRRQFIRGLRPYSPWLETYIKNRDSNQWRSTRALEKLCEYILYLEETIQVICFRDRTWCASPDCKGECGRKMTPEIKAEAKKSPFPIAWGMFCGGEDYPKHSDIQKAMREDKDVSDGQE